MTFAEEIRQAVTHDPVSVVLRDQEAYLAQFPEGAQREAARAALPPLKPRLRVTEVEVLEFVQGLPLLVALGTSRGFYATPTWANLNLSGASREEQWAELIRGRDTTPDFRLTAVWSVGGRLARVLQRESGRTIFVQVVVGAGANPQELLEMKRALWDVGAEDVYGYVHRDHPNLAHLRATRGDAFIQSTLSTPRVHPRWWSEGFWEMRYQVDARKERP